MPRRQPREAGFHGRSTFRLALVAAAAVVVGCVSVTGEGTAEVRGPDARTPTWVREVPNEPGKRLYAVALLTGAQSTQEALEKARENLLDKAFATTYRAGRIQHSRRANSPTLLRTALASVTEHAPRVISERYRDPQTGQHVLAVMVSLDFRMWHTAVYGFPPRSGERLTHALLSAHARHGDRPFHPDDETVDEVTAPVDEEDAPPTLGRPLRENAEEAGGVPDGTEPDDAEPSSQAEPSVKHDQRDGEAKWTLSRPPGRVRVVVVAVPDVRDASLAGWPSAAQDGRMHADVWSEHSLAVENGHEGRYVELEADSQPRLLTGAQATRPRIKAALDEALEHAAAVVFVYLGAAHTSANGDLMLLTVDSERERLAETAFPAKWLAQRVEESAVPGLVLLDGVVPPENDEPGKPGALGWPTLWPSQPGHEPYVDPLRGHGLVSYFATRGLERNRADSDGNGRTTSEEWMAYINRNVAAASRHRGREQRPWFAEPERTPRTAVIPVH